MIVPAGAISPHRLLIVTGHFGTGKTEFSVNLALALARDISEKTGIPVLCHTAEERLIPELTALEEPIFPITIQMKKPWER